MKFTPQEDQYLKDNYLTIPAKRISKNLGRSESGDRQRIKLLGLVVPLEIIEKFKRDSQIKPGTISFNKGKKQSEYMTPEAIERTKATRFNKGNEPHNTKFDGYERISKDGYVEIRVRKGKFQLKHRVEWEKVNGKIPPEHILVCLGVDITNSEPSNWGMITMKENLARNNDPDNPTDNKVAMYMAMKSKKVNKELQKQLLSQPELLKAKKYQLLLNRKIHKHGQKQNRRS